jgi:hypothetical protein
MALKSKSDEQVRADIPVHKVMPHINAENAVRVNLIVSKSMRTAWRAEALRRDISLAELIKQAMKNYIGE